MFSYNFTRNNFTPNKPPPYHFPIRQPWVILDPLRSNTTHIYQNNNKRWPRQTNCFYLMMVWNKQTRFHFPLNTYPSCKCQVMVTVHTKIDISIRQGQPKLSSWPINREAPFDSISLRGGSKKCSKENFIRSNHCHMAWTTPQQRVHQLVN